MSILKIESLCKYYGNKKNETKALDGISLEVQTGEFLGIMGSSGSGKSTLLNCVASVIRPTGGQILVNGTDIRSLKGAELSDYRGRQIGYLFQNFELLENLTGRENILLPLALHKYEEKKGEQKLKELAEYLEIQDVLDKFPTQMSGGQKQRLCIARALTVEPKVLLLDEPCSALDVKASAKIEELLKNLKERYTIVIVTHNLAQAKRIADDVAFFQNGRRVETKDAETFWEKPECEETKEFLKG